MWKICDLYFLIRGWRITWSSPQANRWDGLKGFKFNFCIPSYPLVKPKVRNHGTSSTEFRKKFQKIHENLQFDGCQGHLWHSVSGALLGPILSSTVDSPICHDLAQIWRNNAQRPGRAPADGASGGSNGPGMAAWWLFQKGSETESDRVKCVASWRSRTSTCWGFSKWPLSWIGASGYRDLDMLSMETNFARICRGSSSFPSLKRRFVTLQQVGYPLFAVVPILRARG